MFKLPALIILLGLIVIIGLLYNKLNKSGNTFNWKAALLAPWYYAQHGRWGLGLLYGFLFMIPLAGAMVAIYAGIRANTDLPKEKDSNGTLYAVLITAWMVLIVYSQLRT